MTVTDIFIRILNMSISAGYIVAAVLLLRLIFKKAPRWITVVLWGIVALRLVCPFSIESVLSLIPSAETVSPGIMLQNDPKVDTGIPILNEIVNPVISGSFAPDPSANANPLQVWLPTLTVIWVFGMAAFIIYSVVSYVRLRRKIGAAVLLSDNIYQSENVPSAFVLGIIKPRIYLPFDISEKDMMYVVAHEKAHIRRCDHLWKPIGFLLLTIYWFNPLMWVAYVLLCRDIELACDEKVIKDFDRDMRADYSEALLAAGARCRIISACPIAFGEVGVKERVRSVLSYKRPAFWIIIAALVTCAALAICFLTDPLTDGKKGDVSFSREIFTEYEGVYVSVKSKDINSGGYTVFNLTWHNDTDRQITYGESYIIERDDGGTWVNTATKELYFTTVGLILNPNGTAHKSYSTQRFDISASGSYRLRVSFFVDDGEGGYKEYNTWIGFEVGSAAEGSSLREKYPEFYGIDTRGGGLTVYIWQFSESHYSCYLVSTWMDTFTDHSFVFEKGASIAEMRAIIEDYGIDREEVSLHPVNNPASSYYYTIDGEYISALYELFWSTPPSE